MKIASILLVLAGLVLAFLVLGNGHDEVEAWQHPEPESLGKNVPAGYQVMQFEVDGMCCDSCPNKLREWLGEVDGVEQAAVSFRNGRAEALVPEGYDPAPLLDVLNQEKYTAHVAP